MKEKTVVSCFSLAASLCGYFYARTVETDTVPFVMIGGFIGAMLGETFVKWKKDDDDSPKTN